MVVLSKHKKGKYHDWITEEGLLKIEGWAKDGLIDKEIADKIGINERTLTRWKDRFPELMSALKKGKEVVDRQVENALLKRALGYEYEEVKTIVEKSDDDSEKTKRKIEKTIKKVIPDVTAQIFWLKNRKPTEWRDRKDIDVKGAIDIKDNRKYIEKYLENK